MEELTFKQKFPEMAGKEKQLQEELLELIGPDIESDSHVTRDYSRDDYARDQVNAHKKAIRSRIESYLNNNQPVAHDEK